MSVIVFLHPLFSLFPCFLPFDYVDPFPSLFVPKAAPPHDLRCLVDQNMNTYWRGGGSSPTLSFSIRDGQKDKVLTEANEIAILVDYLRDQHFCPPSIVLNDRHSNIVGTWSENSYTGWVKFRLLCLMEDPTIHMDEFEKLFSVRVGGIGLVPNLRQVRLFRYEVILFRQNLFLFSLFTLIDLFCCRNPRCLSSLIFPYVVLLIGCNDMFFSIRRLIDLLDCSLYRFHSNKHNRFRPLCLIS